jgi:hypothetical protein
MSNFMNRLLSHNLWPTLSKLAKGAAKRAAIAYVSSDEHIQFGDGDILICDASPNAVKAGQTVAAVLKRAYDRKATLFSLPGLHAKIVLLNDKALIGSANASGSSANDLIEAGLLTDQTKIVAMAQSFVNQLASQATKIDDRRRKHLLSIKVVRRPMATRAKTKMVRPRIGGHRTWIVGTTEILKKVPEDQDIVENVAEKSKESLSNPRSHVAWIRWTGNSRFRNECKRDDWIIQMWRPRGQKTPSDVYERMPVLAREDFDAATYFFYEDFPKADKRSKTWAEFKSIAVRAGIDRSIKPGSQFEITEDQAELLHGHWKET